MRCEEKLRFRNKAAVKYAARREAEVYGYTKFYYRCPECRSWHLTSKQPKSKYWKAHAG